MNADRAIRVAIIGSFRKHYSEILLAIEAFASAGCEVSSPASSWVLNADAEFVRLASDAAERADVEIEVETLDRILNSDVVFVVAPEGYVGRTTCYEIGRVHERGIRTFYSSTPLDLPVPVSASAVADPWTVAKAIEADGVPAIDEPDLDPSVRTVWSSLRYVPSCRPAPPEGSWPL
jgi:hypothetical protein